MINYSILINIAIFLLFYQVVLFIVLAIVIFMRRLWNKYKVKKDQKDKNEISEIIIDYINDAISYEQAEIKLKRFNSKYILLSALESINRMIESNKWEYFKSKIVDKYLLKIAKKRSRSYYWIRRNFSARCFVLSPLVSNKKIILKLLDDKVFLVRSIAAISAIKVPLKEGVEKIIQHMSVEVGYARIFYRDLLAQADSEEIFNWIEEIAINNKDIKIHLACLDFLSTKTFVLTTPFLKNDISSENELIKLAAIKVLAQNPQEDVIEELLDCLNDDNEEIRIETIKALQHYSYDEIYKKLITLLNTSLSWPILMQTAQTLKKMGNTGLNILSNFQTKNPRADEVVQYVLRFDQ